MPEPLTLFTVGGGAVVVGIQLARRYFDAAKEVFDVVAGCVCLALALPMMAILLQTVTKFRDSQSR